MNDTPKTKAERREEQRNKDFNRTPHHGRSSGRHRENAERNDAKEKEIRKQKGINRKNYHPKWEGERA
jgi:hypothetical protein